MYLCPILNEERVSLKDAARTLGKCSRQVRRYVESGQLRASGGGHGVHCLFARRDLDAFMRRSPRREPRPAGRRGPCIGTNYQQRQAWHGRFDGDTLARIAHAAALRQDNPGKYLHYVNAGFLALWSLPQNTVKGLLRGCLPRLDSVPDETRRPQAGAA